MEHTAASSSSTRRRRSTPALVRRPTFRVDQCGGTACRRDPRVRRDRAVGMPLTVRRRASTRRPQLGAPSGRRTGGRGARASGRCPPRRVAAGAPNPTSQRGRARGRSPATLDVSADGTLHSTDARADRPCLRHDASRDEEPAGAAVNVQPKTSRMTPSSDAASTLRQAPRNCMFPRSFHWQRTRRDNASLTAIVSFATDAGAKPALTAIVSIATIAETRNYGHAVRGGSVGAPGVFDAGSFLHHGGELSAGEVGEGHVLEHRTQAGAERDPHVGEVLGRTGVMQ